MIRSHVICLSYQPPVSECIIVYSDALNSLMCIIGCFENPSAYIQSYNDVSTPELKLPKIA